jgi:hypothetical protein
MKIIAIVSVFLSTVVAGGTARAIDLYTAPSQDLAVLQLFCCNLVNVGTKPMDVILEGRKNDGTVVFATPKTLQPGEGSSACEIAAQAAYCHFKAPSRRVRAMAVHQFANSASYIEAR